MAVLFIARDFDTDEWLQALREVDETLDIRVWPDCGDPDDIDVALTWKHPLGELKRFANLRLISSLGAGVEHILRDPDLPDGVDIVRIVDPNMTAEMTRYVVHAVLDVLLDADGYRALQRQRRWQELPDRTARATIGVLGLGVLGRDAAEKLSMLGLTVRGWSRSPHTVEGVECFHGWEQLDEFLARCTVLVNLLPLTAQTDSLLDSEHLGALPQGAYLINVARGRHLVEDALLDALERGQLSGATLDVMREEPLPPDHPFWSHPRIRITPHVAARSVPASIAPQIVENIRRARSGLPLLNRVDRTRGY